MKILLIMDPGIPVPPPLYGGHERLVAMFSEEYTAMGHDVTLFAGPDSKAPKVKYFGRNDLRRGWFERSIEVFRAWTYLYSIRKDFDLIHNFGRLIYLLPILNSRVKKIMTYGRDVTAKAIRQITSVPNRNLVFTACSNYCVSTGNVAGRWETVYNAIDFSKYRLIPEVSAEAPLIFLGRIDQDKAPHIAIAVAKATNNRLLIAGNVSDENRSYFETLVEPYLDGSQIIYLGPLDDDGKNKYLGMSKALIFPIQWNEPFGMVMVEAMACGTPVLAIKRGSVEEVIDEGITGIKVEDEAGLISSIKKVVAIDRTICRQHAMERFDVKIIAKRYLELFNEIRSTEHSSRIA